MANSSNSTPATERGTHPLNALTPAEIEAAGGIVRAWDGWTETAKFESIRLHYPDKAQCRAEIAAGKAGDSRKAYVSIYDTADNSVSELIVDLSGGAVESANGVPGARPAINVDEFMVCAETVPQHPDFIAAMAKRGVTDLSNIQVDPFSAGNFGFEDEEGRRLVHCLVYMRNDPADNGYAHPVEGLNVLFDLNRVEVLRVIDHAVHDVPMTSSNYQADRPEIAELLRSDLKPIDVSQPDGPSFTAVDPGRHLGQLALPCRVPSPRGPGAQRYPGPRRREGAVAAAGLARLDLGDGRAVWRSILQPLSQECL